MPVPMWVAEINKRVFNKMELKRGTRPVLTHVGRTSGASHRTPLDAHRVDGGFVFICMYGPQSDWVQNVLAAGSAELSAGGEEFHLVEPRIITEAEAFSQLPETTKAPPGFLKVTDYLRMDVAGPVQR